MIIGVDLGTSDVKTDQRVVFPAKICEGESFLEENMITFEQKVVCIGEGEFSTDWNKALKENTLPLLYTALARSSLNNIFQVVLGLPIDQYKRHKDTLKNLICDNRMKSIKLNGQEERHICISDVEIVPEGASAYYNLSQYNKARIGNKQLIIVDIGGRTTDICLFMNNKITKVKSIDVGMLNVYSDIVEKVNLVHTQSFKLEEGQAILDNGLFLYGGEQDISFITPILQKHFNSIWKVLQIDFQVDKGYMYLTGGGSIKFQKAFKNRLKGNLILSDDPVFDNAIGFKLKGENIWRD